MSPFATVHHPIQVAFLGGLIAMGYVMIGAFFLAFFRKTRDGLFLAFGTAFWLMAVGETVVSLSGAQEDASRGELYLCRLAAFVLIIVAILRKNLGGPRT